MKNKNLSVLLVDDDDDDNFFHRRAISKSDINCTVQVCTSGPDALDLLQNKGNYKLFSQELCTPDIIFLDINMPRFSGWDFIEAYAALPNSELKKSHVNIMMLSTSTNPATREKALNTPCISDFMEKPLRADVFESLVQKHLPSFLEK